MKPKRRALPRTTTAVLFFIGVLPALGPNGCTDRGQPGPTGILLKNIELACKSYCSDFGHYPVGNEDVLIGSLCVQHPNADISEAKRGPYIEFAAAEVDRKRGLVLDRWGQPIHYLCPGMHNNGGFDVWSIGRDGIDGTSDDIGNFDTRQGITPTPPADGGNK